MCGGEGMLLVKSGALVIAERGSLRQLRRVRREAGGAPPHAEEERYRHVGHADLCLELREAVVRVVACHVAQDHRSPLLERARVLLVDVLHLDRLYQGVAREPLRVCVDELLLVGAQADEEVAGLRALCIGARRLLPRAVGGEVRELRVGRARAPCSSLPSLRCVAACALLDCSGAVAGSRRRRRACRLMPSSRSSSLASLSPSAALCPWAAIDDMHALPCDSATTFRLARRASCRRRVCGAWRSACAWCARALGRARDFRAWRTERVVRCASPHSRAQGEFLRLALFLGDGAMESAAS